MLSRAAIAYFQENSSFAKKMNIQTRLDIRSVQWTLDNANLHGERFVTSKVRHIERLYKGLFSRGEQTLVRYIESLYYQSFESTSVHCTF